MDGILHSPDAIVMLLLAGIGFVVWLVRLEGGNSFLKSIVNAQQKEIDLLKSRQDTTEDKIANELKQIQIDVALIKGFLITKKYKNAPTSQ